MSDTPRDADDPTFDGSGRPPLASEDLLPPVEPPTASFILQLFVVPAVIVVLIVGAWLAFTWLVHRTDPKDLIEGLKSGGVLGWQRASELADVLRSPRYADFRRKSDAAATLAGILKQEVDAAGSETGMSNEAVMRRFFICRALGEFDVQEGMDELLQAAQTNRDPAERWVRRGAIQAIALRAFNLRHLDPPQTLDHPQLETTLLRLTEDDEPLIRAEATYALGRVATPACRLRLEVLVDDPHADTRYNAAVALAHQGNAKSVETLAEMLEPVPLASVQEEILENNQDPSRLRLHKRETITHNAIQASLELAAQNPSADMSPIVKSLERLVAADDVTLQQALISRRAVSAARTALAQLQRRDEK